MEYSDLLSFVNLFTKPSIDTIFVLIVPIILVYTILMYPNSDDCCKNNTNDPNSIPTIDPPINDICEKIITKFVTDHTNPVRTPYIIGICGGSGSGKTFIAEMIVKTVKKMFPKSNGKDIIIISQDSYYKGGNAETNYDIPSAIDFDLLVKHLGQLKKGEQIKCPIYDFTSHTRKTETKRISCKKIIIVEGILIFTQEHLRNLFDMKIFVDADVPTQIFRRLDRDVAERGRCIKEVGQRYIRDVGPSYSEHVLPSSKYADMSINNTNGRYVGLQIMLNHIVRTTMNMNMDKE